MEKNIQDKITALEAAINSPATPENIKETMRKALDTLRNQKVEVTPYKTYSTIKSCLLDDGDDSDDYIYEGKLIHNVEVLPKDTWEIVEFYNYGVVLKHIPTSVLADSKPNKNVSLDELKSLFASDKIEIDGIEKGNTKVFNLCIKAIIKCIDSLDMAAYKENLLAELNASKTELEKTIEASNLLASEKSNLEKESAEKIQTLESDIAAKSISMEEAKAIQEAETLRLKKQLEDLDALNSMRTLIDMLQDDISKKDFKENTPVESNGKVKVKEIRLFAAEGKISGYGFPKVVNTYEEANDAVMPVYEDAIESSYANKCRFTVTFEDGETYNGDLFVGEKYDNPTKGNVIGKHIKDYLEREIKENRQSEETTKEIKEFLEKYDLGFDESPNNDYDGSDKFVDYVNDFYGKEGIYADQFKSKGFTKDEIKEAVNNYISDIDKRDDDNFTWGNGDTVDRERVRTYLEKMDSEKYENGGAIDRFKNATSKAKKEINFLTEKGYSIDSYSTENQDSVFGEGNDVIFATQGSKRPSKSSLEFAISYFYENEESGVVQIEESLLDLIAEGFSNFKVTLYTNAGVDLHSKYKGKYKNVEVVKVPFDEFNKYENGGEVVESRIDKMVRNWNEIGKAWSKISNDDGEFFERIGISEDKIGTSSDMGTDLIYYDTDKYDIGGKKRFEKGGKLKGTWGQSFPEVGRTGMYKGTEVIVTANRAGDILFDELDENEKVIKSDKASLNEFRSYFRPFEPRETDVIYAKGGKIEAGDEIIITTDSLGKQYEGMRGVINDRKLTNDDMYSVKLANGLEMAFNKSEFRHNSVNPRW